MTPKPMSAEARAEEIIRIVFESDKGTQPNTLTVKSGIIQAIAAQITEACAEAFDNGAIDQQRRCTKHIEQARQEGFAAGIEAAAKYLTECDLQHVGVRMVRALKDTP